MSIHDTTLALGVEQPLYDNWTCFKEYKSAETVAFSVCILTLQVVTYPLFHFLGFIFPATNKLWKKQSRYIIQSSDVQLLSDQLNKLFTHLKLAYTVEWVIVAKRA